MSASASASPPNDRRRRRRGLKKKRDGAELAGDEEEDGMELDKDNASDTEDKISVSEDEDEEDEDEEGGWDGSNGSSEDEDIEVPTRALCIFCNQDEEHDPSDEYEPWLECAVCGSSSHRQCARTAKAESDENGESITAANIEEEFVRWKCPPCEEISAETEPAESLSSNPRQLSQPIVDEGDDASDSGRPDQNSIAGSGLDGTNDAAEIEEGKTNAGRSRSARKRKSDELDDFAVEPQPPKKVSRRRGGISATRKASEDGPVTPAPKGTGRPRGRPRLKKVGAPGVNIRIKPTSRYLGN